MRERVEKPELSELEQHTFLREYTGNQLYNAADTVPTMDGQELFGDDTAIAWDFGCGRGERIVELAKDNPDKKYVGVDIHHPSLMIGVRSAADNAIDNVRFIKADCELLIPYMPTSGSESAAVLFPAPVPKNGEFKGMPKPEFAAQIHRILQAHGSLLEFASDSEPYFNYRMRQISRIGLFTCDVMELSVGLNNSDTPTRYQRVWESKGIPTYRTVLRKIEA